MNQRRYRRPPPPETVLLDEQPQAEAARQHAETQPERIKAAQATKIVARKPFHVDAAHVIGASDPNGLSFRLDPGDTLTVAPHVAKMLVEKGYANTLA